MRSAPGSRGVLAGKGNAEKTDFVFYQAESSRSTEK
jgi:hypothetical protein